MTPAVAKAKKAKIPYTLHEYDHDPSVRAFGREAAEKLGMPEERLFKTLVVATGPKDLAVAVVPVSGQLDLKAFAKAVGVKKTAMADKTIVERTTGYLTGGVSPIGQKKGLPTVIDDSANAFDTIYVSAGKRGLQICLAPKDLAALTRGRFAAIVKRS
ncbi:MAG TPA: Cys-tRNA(Pro) deacylase [Desulfobacteraceae bacterium]|mgnify:CR=1 FL=1|nr:Cys-tRNA(Pro) deacylase [Desulfobacteraceae bacterium]